MLVLCFFSHYLVLFYSFSRVFSATVDPPEEKPSIKGEVMGYLNSVTPKWAKKPEREKFRVFRRTQASLPAQVDPLFNWEWSYWLNTVVSNVRVRSRLFSHVQVVYTLDVCIGEATSGTLGQKGFSSAFFVCVFRFLSFQDSATTFCIAPHSVSMLRHLTCRWTFATSPNHVCSFRFRSALTFVKRLSSRRIHKSTLRSIISIKLLSRS